MKNFKMPSFGSLVFAFIAYIMVLPLIGQAAASIFSGGIVLSSCLPMPSGVLGLNNTNNASARDSYAHAMKMFYNAFRDKFEPGAAGDKRCLDFVNSLKLSQSEVRLEVELSATKTAFQFAVTSNVQNTSGVIFPTEERLNQQDSLCVNEYGIFIGNPVDQNDINWALRTYPNTQDFTANDVTQLNNILYSNGNFQMNCNNDVIMPYRGLWNHLYRPQTQQTAALGAASPQDQVRGAEDGMITDEPNIVLIGSKKYQPIINLKANLALTEESGYTVRAIFLARGILAQNSTVIS